MKKLKALCAALLLPALVTAAVLAQAGSSRTPPDLSHTFNATALASEFALSCTEQEALRRRNLLPPYFDGTPPAFENRQGLFALYSAALTPAQRRRAEELFNAVPPHVRAIAYRGGGVYVFPRRGIVEAVPALREDRSYYSDTGLYMAVQRHLFVPFERAHVTAGKDGKLRPGRWVPSQREPFRIVNHESGHMIDDLAGDFSLNSQGADGDHRLSNRADFVAAYNNDLRRLIGPSKPVSAQEIMRLGYYLPNEFEGKKLGGLRDKPERARREVFAELWAEAQGYDANRLSKAMPDTYVVVKALSDYLKRLHDNAPVRCTYAPDGTARPAP